MRNLIQPIAYTALFSWSVTAQATVIVQNNWLYSKMSIEVTDDLPPYDVQVSEAYRYMGAAIDKTESVQGNDPSTGYGGQATLRYAVGRDIIGFGSPRDTTLFSGYTVTDDSAFAWASSYFQTDWVFSATENTDFRMFAYNEFGGSGTFRLFNETTGETIADEAFGANTPFESIGILDQFNTYSLSLSIDRIDRNVGDGTSMYSFAFNDDYRLSSNLTHYPVPAPATITLLGLGIVGLGFVKRRRAIQLAHGARPAN